MGHFSTAILAAAVWLLAGCNCSGAPANAYTDSLPSRLAARGYRVVDSANGAGLYEKTVIRNGSECRMYLQVLDMRRMKVLQHFRAASGTGAGTGRYLASDSLRSSPFYRRLAAADVVAQYAGSTNPRVFSIINGAFFEQYDDSTQLSFPVKANGVLVTTGSSTYGPITNPADPYYKRVQLKALVFGQQTVDITDYDTGSGFPLQHYPNAIVTYAYADHPAKVLAGNQVNRYHVLAVANADGQPGNELLMVLTVDRDALTNAAAALREAGASEPVITIDGGSSVLLWNHRKGTLLRPAPNEPMAPGTPVRLPHFLVFVHGNTPAARH